MGQPQCFRRQILWELPMSCQARISSLTLYAVQRGDFIWQQRDLRPCDSDSEPVFRAVGPRAAVRLDGDDIGASGLQVSSFPSFAGRRKLFASRRQPRATSNTPEAEQRPGWLCTARRRWPSKCPPARGRLLEHACFAAAEAACRPRTVSFRQGL